MRIVTGTFAAAVCVIAVGASASPHAHRHMHQHQHKKRDAKADTQVVTVPGAPEVVYKFEDTTITEKEVCQGIMNGTFVWAEGTSEKPNCKDPPAPPPATTSAAPAPSPAAANVKQNIKSPSDADKPASKLSTPSPDKGDKGDKGSSGSSGSSGPSGSDSTQISGNGDVDKEFQTGVHDCSEFPEQYGAVKIPWMNVGGWSGIQFTSVLNGAVGKIDTAVSGGGCKSGAYCSYACPPGYQKSQWPTQTSDTSVGGLLCGSDGKLHLSNPDFKKICIAGTGKATVENNLSGKNVAICRTDYPGTESETVPLNTQPGSKSPLTCPDASSYYKHKDIDTSAQYYVNLAGKDVNTACAWGSDETDSGNAYGNWAPVNMGVGTNSQGATFVSLLSTEQNYPKKVVPLNFNIELKGDFGGSACMYIVKNGQGQFCSSGTMQTPQNCKAHGQYVSKQGPVPGCTVQVFSGQANYVLSEI